ncbi:hypothetical protein RIF29_19665 [Crotalaria pallida]|uniref:Uncharacterized protein n=1 Tax=Crotalaria pallida TaxID=3830 RepID=A0AAN9EZU0_CROPI
MAEEKGAGSSTPYLEVNCTSSGKTRRFAAGTDAGFAVSLINGKLKTTEPVSLHIEAVKYGEEPIAFGPNSVLVNYGKGWILHTVTKAGLDFVSSRGEINRDTDSPLHEDDGSRARFQDFQNHLDARMDILEASLARLETRIG